MSELTRINLAQLQSVREQSMAVEQSSHNFLKGGAAVLVAGALVVAACGDDGESVSRITIAPTEAVADTEPTTTALLTDTTNADDEDQETTTTVAARQTTTTQATPSTTPVSYEAADSVAEALGWDETRGVETEADLNDKYGNIITGATSAKEVGKFEILKTDAETSKENFYNDIRHNPQTLAFYDVCTDQEVPNYENCADEDDKEGASTLEDAGERLDDIYEMSLEEKGKLAEEVIARFEAMKFEGVTEHFGLYKTFRLKLDAQGNVIGYEESTNNRSNDLRIRFTYIDKNGDIQELEIRSCAQLTEDVPTPETTTTVPTTTTPDTTVPETTVPETTLPPTTTSTTTTVPTTTSTTTTVPSTTSTTTTTVPTTTSTTTTVPTTTSTTTTVPSTTSTTTTTTIPVTTTTRPEVSVPVSSVPIGGEGAGGEEDDDDDPENNVTTSTTTPATTIPTSSTTTPPITAPPSVTSTTLGPVIVD
jgi:hypothetical protein